MTTTIYELRRHENSRTDGNNERMDVQSEFNKVESSDVMTGLGQL
jgi:hypothetical protein